MNEHCVTSGRWDDHALRRSGTPQRAFYSALRKHPGGGAGMVTEQWEPNMQTESSVCEGKEGRVITTQEKQFWAASQAMGRTGWNVPVNIWAGHCSRMRSLRLSGKSTPSPLPMTLRVWLGWVELWDCGESGCCRSSAPLTVAHCCV